ncbi:MAG: undecaprenyl-phosphate glucose phosphotransferase [Lachnospiraceae bacterium]|nr:undecaprenyl-phosphate glucose phosphotransferase [Lachnospiraceae bacterium]
MIKDNQQIFNRLMCLLDALIAGGCFILGYVIKFYVLQDGPGPGVLPISSYYSLLPFLVPGHLLILLLSDVYTPRRTGKSLHELADVFRANTISLVALLIIMYVIVHESNYARSVITIYYVLNMVVDFAYRIILRRALRKFRSKGYNQKHILLVGYSRAAEAYMDRIRENPQWGVNVVGVLDDHVPAGASYHGVKVLGTLGNLEIILPENKLDEVAVTLPLQDYDYLEHVVNFCEKFGVHTKFIPDYNSVVPTRPYTEDVDGLPVINIRHVPLTNSGNIFIKRVTDIVGSLFGIVITSPLMLICAILIKCTSKGPVIFSQERVGLHNKQFKMYKFRTMKVQADEVERKGWTTRNDPRVTAVGRILRRTSIDELPQLFNILKGDMSLVGPRPERPQYVEKFMEEIPRYMVKHQVRPGLTGWAQVNGLRGDTSIRKRIEYDIYYIENWTYFFDVKIILMTFFTGFVNKNAY